MGRMYKLPPSAFEIEHGRFLAISAAYQREHDGDLPNTPAWDRLERRYDLNPMRFAAWHPNIALMIERSRCDVPPPDCGSSAPPHCGETGGGGSQIVPEPPGIALALVAAIVWMGVMWGGERSGS